MIQSLGKQLPKTNNGTGRRSTNTSQPGRKGESKLTWEEYKTPTDFAAKSSIIFCNDHNALMRIEIRSTFSINSFCYLFVFSSFIWLLVVGSHRESGSAQGKLGFSNFSPITEIDGTGRGDDVKEKRMMENSSTNLVK
ncbi:hypothetical protein YC2023_071137 [Brassica napus]